MDKKTKNYLQLFGLPANYTLADLKNAYRTLAKLNHPDLNPDASAAMRMVLLNEGFEYLTAEVGRIHSLYGAIDPVYVTYRQGVDIMSEAFDAYYEFGGDESTLKTELARAKQCFSVIVKDFPMSDWLDDSIDKICSINRWL